MKNKPTLELADAKMIAAAAEAEALKNNWAVSIAIVDDGGPGKVARILSGEEIMPPAYVLKPHKPGKDGKVVEEQLLVTRRPALTGEHVTKAIAYFDQQGYGV
jgi:preprotein translocase subunit SecD